MVVQGEGDEGGTKERLHPGLVASGPRVYCWGYFSQAVLEDAQ